MEALFRQRLDDKEIVYRFLEESDYDLGILKLYSQLTVVESISQKQFNKIVALNKDSSVIVVAVAQEQGKADEIIGTFKILFEYKFTRGGVTKGHLEDVVVDSEYRKKGIGRKLMELATLIAKERGCYKLIGTTRSSEKPKFYTATEFDGDGVCFYKMFQ